MEPTIEELERALKDEKIELRCVTHPMDIIHYKTVVFALQQAIDIAKGESKWQPIDEWVEEYGDVDIVFFDDRGALWGTLLSTPLSSDYPVHTHGLTGYFKRVDFSDLPTPPKEQEND